MAKKKTQQKPIQDITRQMQQIDELGIVEEENPVSKTIEYLFSDENMEKKTELDKPLKWSALKMIEQKLRAKKLRKSATLLKRFTETCFRYLVSYKRKGIHELIEALKSLTAFEKQQQIDEIKSLTGM